jgi:hypothetical protein
VVEILRDSLDVAYVLEWLPSLFLSSCHANSALTMQKAKQKGR